MVKKLLVDDIHLNEHILPIKMSKVNTNVWKSNCISDPNQTFTIKVICMTVNTSFLNSIKVKVLM